MVKFSENGSLPTTPAVVGRDSRGLQGVEGPNVYPGGGFWVPLVLLPRKPRVTCECRQFQKQARAGVMIWGLEMGISSRRRGGGPCEGPGGFAASWEERLHLAVLMCNWRPRHFHARSLCSHHPVCLLVSVLLSLSPPLDRLDTSMLYGKYVYN